MESDEVWHQLLDGVCRCADSAGRLPGTVTEYVGSLYDMVLARANVHATETEDLERRANFMCRVGEGLYEKHRYEAAVEILSGAAVLYEQIEGRQRAEGLYRCYGNINYCYRELGDRTNERTFALMTLEMEKQAKIFRDEAVTPGLLAGRDTDFSWGTRTKE